MPQTTAASKLLRSVHSRGNDFIFFFFLDIDMSDVLLLQEQLRKQVQQQEVRLKARFKYSSGSFQSFCHWMVLVPSWEPAGDANFAKRVGSEDGGVA